MLSMIGVGFAFHWHWVPEATRGTIYVLHKNTGLVILALLALRLMWRFSQAVPDLSVSTPNWQRLAYRANTFALYTVMALFPLSGVLMSLFHGHDVDILGMWVLSGFQPEDHAMGRFFNQTHFWTAWLSVGLITLHVAAAVYHHWILKDRTLIRMVKGH